MVKVEFTAPEVGKWAPTVESGDLVRALQGREVSALELRAAPAANKLASRCSAKNSSRPSRFWLSPPAWHNRQQRRIRPSQTRSHT